MVLTCHVLLPGHLLLTLKKKYDPPKRRSTTLHGVTSQKYSSVHFSLL
jgi:hypothetical protein